MKMSYMWHNALNALFLFSGKIQQPYFAIVVEKVQRNQI